MRAWRPSTRGVSRSSAPPHRCADSVVQMARIRSRVRQRARLQPKPRLSEQHAVLQEISVAFRLSLGQQLLVPPSRFRGNQFRNGRRFRGALALAIESRPLEPGASKQQRARARDGGRHVRPHGHHLRAVDVGSALYVPSTRSIRNKSNHHFPPLCAQTMSRAATCTRPQRPTTRLSSAVFHFSNYRAHAQDARRLTGRPGAAPQHPQVFTYTLRHVHDQLAQLFDARRDFRRSHLVRRAA